MIETQFENKEAKHAAPVPRMLGDADYDLVLSRLQLSSGPILEVGPWLGAITQDFARHAPVVVIDRFLWSAAEAQSYPGIANAGDSFRPVFEANLGKTEFEVTVIESDVRDAKLPGGVTFDFCFYDGPRSAEDLHYLMSELVHSFSNTGQILIKNVFGSRAPDVAAYVNALLGARIVTLQESDQPNWCNIAVLRPGSNWAVLSDVEAHELIKDASVPQDFSDPWYGHSTTVMRILWMCSLGLWGHGIAMLKLLPHLTDNQSIFDDFERQLELNKSDPDMMSIFSVLRNLDLTQRAPRISNGIGSEVEERSKLLWYAVPTDLWQSEEIDPRLVFTDRFETLFRMLETELSKLAGKSVAIIGDLDRELELLCLMLGATSVTSVIGGDGIEAFRSSHLMRVGFDTANFSKFDLAFATKNSKESEAWQTQIGAWVSY